MYIIYCCVCMCEYVYTFLYVATVLRDFTLYADQAGLDSEMSLSLPPKYWYYRHAITYLF